MTYIHTGNQKKGHISLGDQQAYFNKLYLPQKKN